MSRFTLARGVRGDTSLVFGAIMRLRIIALMPPTDWSIGLRTFLPCLQGSRCWGKNDATWPPAFGVLS